MPTAVERLVGDVETSRREMHDGTAAVTAGHEELRTALAATRDDLAAAVTDAVAAWQAEREAARGDAREALADLRDAVSAASTAVQEAAGQAGETVTRSAARAAEAAHDAVTRIVDTLDEQTEHAASELDEVLARASVAAREHADSTLAGVEVRLAATTDQVDEIAGTLTALERVFLRYLEEHDRRAAIERADLVRQFVEQLAEGLTRRERRRLARKLEVPEPVEPPDDVAERLREVVESAAERTFPVSRERVPPRAPAPPGDDGPDVDDAEPDEVGTDGSETVTDDVVLAEVRGLGPAKRAVLLERFGSVDAVRAAPDDELLAVPGVGPALLAELRRALS
jgi:hypothetical protein